MKIRGTNWNITNSVPLTKKAVGFCEAARGQLILHHPFVGRLGLQLDFVPVNDSRIGTIGTNGKVIYFRPEWFCRMPPVSRMASIAHTIWTAALGHAFRRETRITEYFDLASDIEVYSLLMAEKIPMCSKPDLADLFPEHKDVESIYSELPQTENPKRSPDADVHLYQSGIAKLPELPQKGDKKEPESVDNDTRNAKSVGMTAGQPSLEAPDAGLANNENCGGAQADAGQEKPEKDVAKGELDAACDCECDPGMWEIWRQRILEAAQNYEMCRGTLPRGIANVVSLFRNGKIDYKQLLRKYLTLHSGGESHWLPPARRFIWQGMYLPSRQTEFFAAIVALDVSGSTQSCLQNFFGEVMKIIRDFGRYQMTVIQCDADIQSVETYTNDTPPPEKISIKGGGGTDFCPVFRYVKEHRLSPKVLLYYTDGYGAVPQSAPPYPVIWCLTGEGNEPASWGKIIHVTEVKK